MLPKLSIFALTISTLVAGQVYMTGLGIFDGEKESQAVINSVLPYYSIPQLALRDPDTEDLRCRTSDIDKDIQVVQVAKAGDTLISFWEKGKTLINAASEEQDITGPCLVYLAPYDNGGDDGWFKIYGYGFDHDNNRWCSQGVNADGNFRFSIPSSVPAGKYYLRAEIIGLNQAEKSYWDDYSQGAQFYNNCGLINILASESTEMPKGVAIPSNDFYKKDDPGLIWKMGNDVTQYILPGPADISLTVTPGGSGSL